MEGPMMEARALTPLTFLHSFPAFFSHHHHHPCLATSSISFLGGIGIALFSSSSHCRLLSTVTLLLEYLLEYDVHAKTSYVILRTPTHPS
jgi:hypothetical protein